MKRIPPTVFRVAAPILLGSASTVAVAWLLALFVDGNSAALRMTEVAQQIIPTPPNSPQQTGVHFVDVLRTRTWGTDIVEIWPSWAEDATRPAYGSTHALVEGTSFESEMKEKFDRNEAPTAWWRADGWPLQAFSAEARWSSFDALGVSHVIDGVLVGPRNVFPSDGVRILPLRPIWTGIVIDFFFFTLLWYLLFSLGVIRSALRRWRGLCGRCGYRLLPEQDRCSECGEAIRFASIGH